MNTITEKEIEMIYELIENSGRLPIYGEYPNVNYYCSMLTRTDPNYRGLDVETRMVKLVPMTEQAFLKIHGTEVGFEATLALLLETITARDIIVILKDMSTVEPEVNSDELDGSEELTGTSIAGGIDYSRVNDIIDTYGCDVSASIDAGIVTYHGNFGIKNVTKYNYMLLYKKIMSLAAKLVWTPEVPTNYMSTESLLGKLISVAEQNQFTTRTVFEPHVFSLTQAEVDNRIGEEGGHELLLLMLLVNMSETEVLEQLQMIQVAQQEVVDKPLGDLDKNQDQLELTLYALKTTGKFNELTDAEYNLIRRHLMSDNVESMVEKEPNLLVRTILLKLASSLKNELRGTILVKDFVETLKVGFTLESLRAGTLTRVDYNILLAIALNIISLEELYRKINPALVIATERYKSLTENQYVSIVENTKSMHGELVQHFHGIKLLALLGSNVTGEVKSEKPLLAVEPNGVYSFPFSLINTPSIVETIYSDVDNDFLIILLGLLETLSCQELLVQIGVNKEKKVNPAETVETRLKEETEFMYKNLPPFTLNSYTTTSPGKITDAEWSELKSIVIISNGLIDSIENRQKAWSSLTNISTLFNVTIPEKFITIEYVNVGRMQKRLDIDNTFNIRLTSLLKIYTVRDIIDKIKQFLETQFTHRQLGYTDDWLQGSINKVTNSFDTDFMDLWDIGDIYEPNKRTKSLNRLRVALQEKKICPVLSNISGSLHEIFLNLSHESNQYGSPAEYASLTEAHTEDHLLEMISLLPNKTNVKLSKHLFKHLSSEELKLIDVVNKCLSINTEDNERLEELIRTLVCSHLMYILGLEKERVYYGKYTSEEMRENTEELEAILVKMKS